MARGKKFTEVSLPSTFPFGKQTVGKIAPSTGIYGKRVGGKPTSTAVRVRKGRR